MQFSGLAAFDGEGNLIVAGDFYVQSMQSFKNIEEARGPTSF